MNKGIKQLIQVILILGVFAALIAAFYFISDSIGRTGNMGTIGIAVGIFLAIAGIFFGVRIYRRKRMDMPERIPLLSEV
jgi:hypothetical protein